jgi:hypothetical protein
LAQGPRSGFAQKQGHLEVQMTSSIVDTTGRQDHPVRDKAVDAVRHTAHVSHEARLLKTIAADAVDDGVYAAKRVIKTASTLDAKHR